MRTSVPPPAPRTPRPGVPWARGLGRAWAGAARASAFPKRSSRGPGPSRTRAARASRRSPRHAGGQPSPGQHPWAVCNERYYGRREPSSCRAVHPRSTPPSAGRQFSLRAEARLPPGSLRPSKFTGRASVLSWNRLLPREGSREQRERGSFPPREQCVLTGRGCRAPRGVLPEGPGLLTGSPGQGPPGPSLRGQGVGTRSRPEAMADVGGSSPHVVSTASGEAVVPEPRRRRPCWARGCARAHTCGCACVGSVCVR